MWINVTGANTHHSHNSYSHLECRRDWFELIVYKMASYSTRELRFWRTEMPELPTVHFVSLSLWQVVKTYKSPLIALLGKVYSATTYWSRAKWREHIFQHLTLQRDGLRFRCFVFRTVTNIGVDSKSVAQWNNCTSWSPFPIRRTRIS